MSGEECVFNSALFISLMRENDVLIVSTSFRQWIKSFSIDASALSLCMQNFQARLELAEVRHRSLNGRLFIQMADGIDL